MASLTNTLTPRRAVSAVWLSYARAGAVALVLGGTFGAGVLLGGDEGDEEAAEATGEGASALSVADSRTDKLEEVRAELRLRFHDELVGPPRDAKDRPKAAEPDAPNEPANKEPANTEPANQDAKADGDAKPELKPAPLDPAVEAARQKALADQAAPPEQRDAEESVKDEDADEDVESIAVPRDDKARDQRRIAEALARVLGDDTPAWAKDGAADDGATGEEATGGKAGEKPSAVSPKAERAEGTEAAKPTVAARYHLQVAATPNEDGAEALVGKLEDQGFAAHVVPVDLEGRGRIYRVRIGPFADRATAEARGADVRETAGLNGFVVSE